MSTASLSVSQPFTASVRHAHPAHHGRASGSSGGTSATASGTASKADESIEQLAAQGDPIAIAELRAEHPKPAAAQAPGAAQPAAGRTGASEPGKGAVVDQYA